MNDSTSVPTPTSAAAQFGSSPSVEAERLQWAITSAQRMRSEIQKAFVGQHEQVEQVLLGFLAAGHVLLEGVPGLGKTLLMLALARTFGGRSARVQFTPDLMPSDVTGHVVLDTATGNMRVKRGPAFTNLLLADEINRASAKTQSALLEVMQEGQITIEGESLPVEPPFMAIATQNPLEQEGTYPLPEAQLDRFLLHVAIGYPTEEEELSIVRQVADGRLGDRLDVERVGQVVDCTQAVELQRITSRLRVDPAVAAYAVRIARTTRDWRGIALGAGPRGSIALIRVARAKALLDGRSYVIPSDVKAVALPALRHRIALAPDLELEGVQRDEALRAVLAKVEAPRA
ncbi:MAG: MoxR family ATPase [Planctomycetes bacterium]|nr:MoxR family ATPase [Planctomycetota bacterium]